MAITFIYPIKVTGEKSLNYDTENKEANLIEKKKDDSKDSLEYIMRDKKGNVYQLPSEYMEKMKNYISYDEEKNIIFHTVKTGINCSAENAYNEWKPVRDAAKSGKGNEGNLQYCIVQNFGIDLDPMIANEIGVEFAKKYLSDYQCVVSTHINTGLVHNHIEFNATSFVTGKKFNDNLKAIKDIRKVSDELCQKYEFEILEKTKDFNYVVYKDSNGKTKVYEPTERKNQNREGEYSDKNDYRNTEQYEKTMQYKDSHIKELKADIDRLLPHAESYEDLLQQLKNAGYEIKDKTKKGEWRKQISFKSPTWDKYTRDSSLGEEYQREFLTNIIEENIKKIKDKPMEKTVPEADVKNADIYMYGKIIIEDMDEEYRYRKKKDAYEKVKRSDIEKYIIRDTKKLNKEVNATIRQAMYPKRERIQEMVNGTKRQQYLVDRINSNLKTLRFVEEKEIKSFEQMNEVVKTLCEKRNACQSQLNAIGNSLKKANADIVLMDKYNSLKHTIENNQDNADYILHEKENDVALLRTYENFLRQKDLLSMEKQEQFKENYQKYNAMFLKLSQVLEKVNRDIREYDDCIYNMKEVDKNNGNRYTAEIETYYTTKESYKRSSKTNSRNER